MLQITRLSKNLLLSVNVAENDEIGIADNSSDCENETIERSSFKNSNKATGYLTLNARQVFIKLKQVFTNASIL